MISINKSNSSPFRQHCRRYIKEYYTWKKKKKDIHKYKTSGKNKLTRKIDTRKNYKKNEN
jgi:hypothetical protein